jgi:hypothetical protein
MRCLSPAADSALPPTFPSARSAPAIAAEVIALAAILVLAAYLRFDALGARSLWLDEFSTWHVSRLPLGQSLTWGPELTIPPLYQLLLRLLSPDPHPDEWVLRFPAAVAGLGAVAAAWWLGRTVAGAAAGCALAALMACNPLQIEYSREARPYSLLVLGCVLSTAAWYRLVSGCARRPTREWEVAETGIGPEPARWRSGFGRGSDATEWGGPLARQRRPRRADATAALGEGRTGLFIAYVAAAARQAQTARLGWSGPDGRLQVLPLQRRLRAEGASATGSRNRPAGSPGRPDRCRRRRRGRPHHWY